MHGLENAGELLRTKLYLLYKIMPMYFLIMSSPLDFAMNAYNDQVQSLFERRSRGRLGRLHHRLTVSRLVAYSAFQRWLGSHLGHQQQRGECLGRENASYVAFWSPTQV